MSKALQWEEHCYDDSYRYGFNGMEKDDEVAGEGNSYDFGARMYDSRVARFLSLDPRMHEFSFMTPYCYAANNPIRFIDVEGEGPGETEFFIYEFVGEVGDKEFHHKIKHHQKVEVSTAYYQKIDDNGTSTLLRKVTYNVVVTEVVISAKSVLNEETQLYEKEISTTTSQTTRTITETQRTVGVGGQNGGSAQVWEMESSSIDSEQTKQLDNFTDAENSVLNTHVQELAYMLDNSPIGTSPYSDTSDHPNGTLITASGVAIAVATKNPYVGAVLTLGHGINNLYANYGDHTGKSSMLTADSNASVYDISTVGDGVSLSNTGMVELNNEYLYGSNSTRGTVSKYETVLMNKLDKLQDAGFRYSPDTPIE